ncbi:hypothetical protein KJY77_04670 [Canibacter sp. lx-72]|uniref:hypothetical protein n=1 Tax=Canibacter zhuwentaonis TaxID=2837491 RepID=UPI001BDD6DA9|nr:hypothetical protein [Canibacter zhuwentaonis]MBT1018430.1 hypothetical protein [Canibacter zhuwentaonis]
MRGRVGSAGEPTGVVPTRRITRGYLAAVIFFTTLAGVSLLVAGWGITAYITETQPALPPMPVWFLPSLVLLAVGVTSAAEHRCAIKMLRGVTVQPALEPLLLGAVLVALWLGQALYYGANLFARAQLSYFLIYLGSFMLAYGACWAALYRRIYTAKDTPLWWWERRERNEAERRRQEIVRLRMIWEQSEQ